LERDDAHGLRINDLLCGGCSMCEQICPTQSISKKESAQ